MGYIYKGYTIYKSGYGWVGKKGKWSIECATENDLYEIIDEMESEVNE